MPFDAGGNFTRVHNWQEDRDNGIRIMADRHDEEDDNLAAGLNQAFLRTGVVPMTGNLQVNGHRVLDVASGTLLQPGLTFELDNDTGFFQPGSGQLAVVINGYQRSLWTDAGLQVDGDITATGHINLTGDINAPTGKFQHLIVEHADPAQYTILEINGFRDYAFQAYPDSLIAGGGLRLVDVTAGLEIFNVKADGTTVFNQPTNFSSTVMFPNGSAAAPGIRFADNDSGMFQGGDGVIAISTNGAERFKIDGTGNILITNSPNFYISGTTYFNSTATANGFYASSAGASSEYRHINFSPNQHIGYNNTSGVFQINLGGASRLTINQADGWATFNNNVTINGALGVNNGVTSTFLKSTGEVHSDGLFYSRATGLSAGLRAINANIGHDFRLIAKDDGTFSLTNESAGISYLACHHTGDISIFRQTHMDGVVHHNNLVYVNNSRFRVQNDVIEVNGANGALNIKDRGDGYDWMIYGGAHAMFFWQASGGTTWEMISNIFQPGTDGTHAVGNAARRMNAVFCLSASMNTCDEREKNWIGPLNEQELAFGKALALEIGSFKWKNKEHDNDQIQVGVRAQTMIALMETHELDWNDYGFIRHDAWEEKVTQDVDGNDVVEPAGDRYSVRLPELALFIAASQEQRIQALEALVNP